MNKSEIAEKVKFEQFMRDIADKRFTSYFTSENSELFWACWERAIAESQAPTVTLSQGGCSGTMPVYGAELGGGEPSPSPYTDHVSTEPLDVIRANECESTPSLTTSRFRALWNEIVRLRSGAAQEVSPSANFVSEIRPRPDDPSCHVCGARMVVKEWKCLSCKATTGVEEVSPPSPEPRETDGHPVGWCCKHCYDGGYQAAMRLLAEKAEGEKMNDKQIKQMVDRFLGWRLPGNFNPDGGISFKPIRNEKSPWPAKNEPTGTNVLDAMQAEAMVRYLVDGLELGDTRELKAALMEMSTELSVFVDAKSTVVSLGKQKGDVEAWNRHINKAYSLIADAEKLLG